MKKALLSLTPREERVIRLRHGLGACGPSGATLEEIASDFGCSKERVRQIQSRAFRKLKRKLVKQRRAPILQVYECVPSPPPVRKERVAVSTPLLPFPDILKRERALKENREKRELEELRKQQVSDAADAAEKKRIAKRNLSSIIGRAVAHHWPNSLRYISADEKLNAVAVVLRTTEVQENGNDYVVERLRAIAADAPGSSHYAFSSLVDNLDTVILNIVLLDKEQYWATRRAWGHQEQSIQLSIL